MSNDPQIEKSPPKKKKKAALSRPSPAGAAYEIQHMALIKHVYPIDDDGMDVLGTFNALTTLFFSLAAGFGTKAFDVWTAVRIESGPSESTRQWAGNMECVLAFSALVFAVIGGWAWKNKSSRIARIKKEARPITI